MHPAFLSTQLWYGDLKIDESTQKQIWFGGPQKITDILSRDNMTNGSVNYKGKRSLNKKTFKDLPADIQAQIQTDKTTKKNDDLECDPPAFDPVAWVNLTAQTDAHLALEESDSIFSSLDLSCQEYLSWTDLEYFTSQLATFFTAQTGITWGLAQGIQITLDALEDLDSD